MCDFRPDPTAVLKVDTGEIFPVKTIWPTLNDNGVIENMQLKFGERYEDLAPGVYGIPATCAAYVVYYDGQEWHRESTVYNPTNYQFLRPPHEEKYHELLCGPLLTKYNPSKTTAQIAELHKNGKINYEQ